MQWRLANQRGCTANEVEEARLQVSHKIPGCAPDALVGVEVCTYTSTCTEPPQVYVHTCSLCHTHTHSHSVAPQRKRKYLFFQGSWPAGEQGVGLKLISSANQKRRSLRAAVHGRTLGGLALFIYSIGYLVVSAWGWNLMRRMQVIGLRPEYNEITTYIFILLFFE